MKKNNYHNTIDFDFWLLLFYSLLPGFSKILDKSFIMGIYIPILLYLILKKKIYFFKIDIAFLLFVFFIFLNNLLWIGFRDVNKQGIILGIAMNFIPMCGFFLFRHQNPEKLCKQLLIIIMIHGFIGIYLYPPFRIANFSHPYVVALVEGVAFGRMASVSGSLGFGNLIMVGFILALYIKPVLSPFFFICVIFSAQRSAWLGAIIAILLLLLYYLKNGKILKVKIIVLVLLLLGFIGYFILKKFIHFDFSFILLRLSNLFSGATEDDGVRINLWKNGIDNFKLNIMGTGIGQVGQIGTRFVESSYKPCPDGDYFRMLSEYGINFLVFFIVVVFIFLYLFFLKKLAKIQMCIYTISFCTAIGLIGSNITEFYFVNFLFWIFIGFNFNFANTLFNKRKRQS